MALHRRSRTKSLAEHRRELGKDYRSLGDEPLVVMDRGTAVGVVLSPQIYDALVDELEAARLALKALRAAVRLEAGEGTEAREGLAARREAHARRTGS